MDIAERLTEYMGEKELSANALAKLSGVSQTMISSILRRANNPSIQTMELICNALGITMSDFFSGDMEKSLERSNTKPDFVYSGQSADLQNELIALYGDAKENLDKDDIEDIRLFIQMKNARKKAREQANDKHDGEGL